MPPPPPKKVKKGLSSDLKKERLLKHRQIGFGGHLQGKHSTDWVSKPRSSCSQPETLREIKAKPINSKCIRKTQQDRILICYHRIVIKDGRSLSHQVKCPPLEYAV
ncbi:hypothetical protein KIL84_000425 [Mauremys mutica]|uniref:Uncharacterized protein n=1 Tax=Mauremys mutica TaxID=74926 RepID=A0A9D3XCG3_9SAUR|nr:hypothetical protein KIL84_000425 [Mauremys mutica]